MSKKKVFLLGGYDLEMLEIKKILDSKNVEYKDKNLSWGAKLSDYQDILEKYKNEEDVILYGVELEANITAPKNYIEIDHHGKNDDKQSSLEQVAKMLDIELSRDQQLISANDSRYIGGMKNLCATKEEIDDIRKRDREVQGITQEDEFLAKESFEIACNNKPNLIYSKTPKFSAVSDLAYYKFDNYVIYNNEKVLFYGYKKENIQEFLKSQDIEESKYYYGGGDFGFVGIKDRVFSEDEIKNILEKFKKFDKKEEIYSYHTFMLPFTFENEFDKKENWKYKHFEIENQRDYNEYVYFYKHIQDAIYNKDTEEKSNISKYYEYEFEEGAYTINCKKGIFELELDGLSLRLFNTNVAILSFNLKNTKYKDQDSILAINDFGRRIYPQFLGEKYTCDTKKSILSNCITLNLDNKFIEKEDFTRFNTINSFKEPKKLNLLPSFISKLIEDNFPKDKEDITTIRPIIDDRMFVISWYGNEDFSENLRNEKYITYDKWYEYVFVDGNGKTVHSQNMQTKLICDATYDRWMDYPWGCTLFGITRYSFVSVTNNSDFAQSVILKHMQTMYFQMFTLLLAYRATIIKFSDDIQNTTNETIQNIEKLSKETEDIYEKYLGFLNKLYFKEVTAQDQGIELYNQAMKVMDIEKYMNDLDHEITQLHNYVDMKKEKERNDKLEFISKIGAILIPPTLLAGLFGMNVLTLEATQNNQSLAFVCIILSALIGFFMTFNFKPLKNIKILKNLLIMIFSFIFIGYVLYLFDFDVKVPLFDKFETNKNIEEIQKIEIKNQPIEVIISKEKGENK